VHPKINPAANPETDDENIPKIYLESKPFFKSFENSKYFLLVLLEYCKTFTVHLKLLPKVYTFFHQGLYGRRRNFEVFSDMSDLVPVF
jgi:hypothetical protein